MDKRSYSPLELLKIATQHAYGAESLLQADIEDYVHAQDIKDALLPVTSLLYIAFQLTLRAYFLHLHRPIRQNKTLAELLDLNSDLAFSAQDRVLLKNLSRQLAFRTGIDYELWEDRQEFLIFCQELLKLYERLQEQMPLELQRDYIT